VRHVHRRKVLVLTYHGVLQESHAHDRFRYQNTVSLAEFDGHLRFLRRRFNPVRLSDVRAFVERRREPPPRSVLVTFDDGYRNNLKYAAPLLARHGVPAVVFLSTGLIGGRRLLWPDELAARVLRWPEGTIAKPDGSGTEAMPEAVDARRSLASRILGVCKQLPVDDLQSYLEYVRRDSSFDSTLPDSDVFAFLDWNEVRALRQYGIECGAHTVNHWILSRVPDTTLDSELVKSKRQIESELQTECFAMAYPNGCQADYNATVVDHVRRAGYALAFTMAGGFHDVQGDPLAFNRCPVPGHVDLAIFEAYASGTYRTMNRLLGRGSAA
jgi:peptidoglycan/xylan/chitin deacetylase (PgdA/CDA1 family)